MPLCLYPLRKKPTLEEIKAAWAEFSGYPQQNHLPSAPQQFLTYFEEENRPQTKLDRDLYNGMGIISLGRLREDSQYDYKFICLSHNTVQRCRRSNSDGSRLILQAKGILTKRGNNMKKTIFTGSAVAIVTPMNPDESIHYEKLGELIDSQIQNGTDAIVICGTTGESATMTDQEHVDCIEYAVKRVGGRVPVIAGAGSNHTSTLSGCPKKPNGWAQTLCCTLPHTTTKLLSWV